MNFVMLPGLILLILLTLSGCANNENSEESKTVSATISLDNWQASRKYFEFNGYRIAYWQSNGKSNARNQRESIVLIHGFPSAAWDWHHIWNTLSQDYDLLAMDLLGYGFSDKPNNHNYSLIEQADLVYSLTAHLGIEQFHILSHDYGVSVSQELLSRNEQNNENNFLLSFCFLNGGAFAEAQNPTVTMRILRSPLGPILIKAGTESVFTNQFKDVFGKNTQPSPEILSGYWQLVEENNGRSVIPQLLSYGDERYVYRDRWVTALQNSEIPKRIIVGMEDKISGSNMVKLYESLIPNPDVVRLQGIGHYPQVEAPYEVISAYKNFLMANR